MIHYSEDKRIKSTDVAEVFRNSGIRRPTEDLARIQKMIQNADVLLTAWSNERIIGIARAVTDFSYCCYLSDLAVDKEYQSQGIGAELVRRVKTIIGDECSLVLLSAPGAMEYYPKIGFEKVEHAFVIKRKYN